MVLEFIDKRVCGLRNVVNPDKLVFLDRQVSHLPGLSSSGGE